MGAPDRDELVEAARAAERYVPDADAPPVVLALPFTGRWLARNSPANRVPSHRTHFLGQTFAVDLYAVDHRRRASGTRDWRTVVGTEPADRFLAFGQPITAPVTGRVAVAHDGVDDHVARRSPITALPYLLTQAGRLRDGLQSIIGNHVVIALDDHGPYVALAHLRRGSVAVRAGDQVVAGERLGECGNSGNSTQPHLHIQVMDSTDLLVARGLPMAFAGCAVSGRGGPPRVLTEGMPRDGETIEPAVGAVP